MEKTVQIEAVRKKYELLRPIMNERMRRQWAASEALSLPRGGVTVVAKATGLSRTTIQAGKRELRAQARLRKCVPSVSAVQGVADIPW